jgi:hypothetical protein
MMLNSYERRTGDLLVASFVSAGLAAYEAIARRDRLVAADHLLGLLGRVHSYALTDGDSRFHGGPAFA